MNRTRALPSTPAASPWSRLALACGLLVLAPACEKNPDPSAASQPDAAAPASAPSSPSAAAAKSSWTEADVHQALKSANPNYNGQAQFKIEQGQVILMQLSGTQVENLSPLKGMPLQALDLRQTRVHDLRALEGMPPDRAPE
jgi:hypothetical protein